MDRLQRIGTRLAGAIRRPRAARRRFAVALLPWSLLPFALPLVALPLVAETRAAEPVRKKAAVFDNNTRFGAGRDSGGPARTPAAPQAGRPSGWERLPAVLYGPLMPNSPLAPGLTSPGQANVGILQRPGMPAMHGIPGQTPGGPTLPFNRTLAPATFTPAPRSVSAPLQEAPAPFEAAAPQGASRQAPGSRAVRPTGVGSEAPPWAESGFAPEAAPIPVPAAGNAAPGNAGKASAATPNVPVSGANLAGMRPQATGVIRPVSNEETAEPAVVQPEPASLKGIQPGMSTQADLDELWDAPKEIESIPDGQRRIYLLPPFEQVEVELHKSIVKSILVNLKAPIPADKLARDLKLGFIEPVVVTSPEGDALGQAFPERGVLFTFDPGAPRQFKTDMPVRQIVLEKIQPDSFILRAELNLGKNYRRAQADLEQALKLQPDDVRARWLQAQVLSAGGSHLEAIQALEKVIAQAPDRPEYRLALAKTLAAAGRPDQAVEALAEAIPQLPAGGLGTAEAKLLSGQLKAAIVPPDWKGSMEDHQAAAKIAAASLKGSEPVDRVQATRLAFEGYLGTGVAIAWGPWKGKETVLPKWLARAEQLIAEPLSADEQAQARYLLARKALAAYVGMEGTPADDRYARTVLEYGERQVEAAPDPVRRGQAAWEVGSALHDALQCCLLAEEYDAAVEFGAKSVHYLEQGFPDQKHQPGNEYLLGRAFFRLGSAYALGTKDMPTSVLWFEKALPLLDKPLPEGSANDVGRLGQTFVSIGVAYWQADRKERALEISLKGMELLQQAAEQDLLPQEELLVPLRNLSMMYRGLGNTEKADQALQVAELISSEAKPEGDAPPQAKPDPQPQGNAPTEPQGNVPTEPPATVPTPRPVPVQLVPAQPAPVQPAPVQPAPAQPGPTLGGPSVAPPPGANLPPEVSPAGPAIR